MSVCELCGHELDGNEHGPDQADFDIEESPVTGEMELIHLGRCLYCTACYPKGPAPQREEAPN